MANNTPRTANVTRLFRSATAGDIAEGLAWYADKHRIADALAVKHGVTLDQAAGVIAAVSPQNSWGNNVNLAARILEAGGLKSGYLGLGLRKCDAILAGADIRETLNGDKIVAFWEGIRTAGETDTVCVDRHAYDIAVNVRNTNDGRPKLSGKRYAAFADVYRRAAVILSAEAGERIWAAQVQAAVWVPWRRLYWADGAFDSHEAI